jgi:hypothetical protein
MMDWRFKIKNVKRTPFLLILRLFIYLTDLKIRFLQATTEITRASKFCALNKMRILPEFYSYPTWVNCTQESKNFMVEICVIFLSKFNTVVSVSN